MTALPLFLMDTHALYWHRLGSRKLSKAAAQVFDDGMAGKALLLVHHVTAVGVIQNCLGTDNPRCRVCAMPARCN
jgi:hypothetical protein